MPLFNITPHDSCTDGEPKISDILVWASDLGQARTTAIEFLIQDGRFGEIENFADPMLHSIERVPTRQARGVYACNLHHCVDHS